MKSADGGERHHHHHHHDHQPPIPEHKPEPPMHHSAPTAEIPQAHHHGGISPTTAAVVTALAMSAAAQSRYGGVRSVSELLQRSSILRFLWWHLGRLAVVVGIAFALGSLLAREVSEFWAGLIFAALGLVMGQVPQVPCLVPWHSSQSLGLGFLPRSAPPSYVP